MQLGQTFPGRSFQIARAIGRVLLDSERTEEIHRVEELTGGRRFERFLRETSGDAELAELLADEPELRSDQVDFDWLRELPAGTLGHAYIHHLDDNGLSADSQAAPTTQVDDPTIAYLMRRFRQTHDVWHALMDLGTAGHEEVIIHAFSWGQMRLPVSALVVFFGTLKHIVFEARWCALRHALLEAYVNGRNAAPLLPVHWERMWEDDIVEVRARYNIKPCTRAYVHRN